MDYIKATKTTTNSLAHAAGVGQPMLFRFLSGETKNLTIHSRKVLNYVHNENIDRITEGHQNKDNADLIGTLQKVLGLDHGTTALLADIVRAIGPLLGTRPRNPQ